MRPRRPSHPLPPRRQHHRHRPRPSTRTGTRRPFDPRRPSTQPCWPAEIVSFTVACQHDGNHRIATGMGDLIGPASMVFSLGEPKRVLRQAQTRTRTHARHLETRRFIDQVSEYEQPGVSGGAPTARRQSADGCALWSRLETRYLRLPSPLRHNIFPPNAPFGPHLDEDLRWRPGAPQACHFASVIANNLSIGNPQAARSVGQ